ncbi:2-hydroxychromene-2-carboxylate isomerase [Undibacterium sp.]|jgi:2-hydroxychromene-2-carboxylate isomerase|uniref:2-hydroxychromene-2-carboxylate isomerase n=1 Tax=Undibacterium sp. TaxID=1914977 RepID=UPI002B7F9EB6|nr:DsbA family protein [Undibacterium sp.]HTD04284.1 DsbA family protein [Undibacterium sp.]
MEQAQWYFDLISPFSYLHYHRLQPLRERLQIQAVPVLFAGLLKHWGTKGPAEVPTKRLHTYQYCVWAAKQQGLAFRMPPRHPFNPLASQRLLVALGATDEVVESAFHFVYGEGRDPEYEFADIGKRLGAVDAASLVAAPEVKQQLAANTQRAIALGVFGVPTLVFRERLFWGSDTIDWVLQFLNEPDLFQQPEYEAVARSEFGIART